MCYLSEHVAPLETPAQGVYIADAGQLTFMGNDALRVAALMPNSIPAQGFVAIHKGHSGNWMARRLQVGTLAEAKAEAREIGRQSVDPVVLGEVARMGGDPFAPVFLINAVSVFEPITRGDLLRDAIKAADDVVGNLHLLRKDDLIDPFKLIDPFTGIGFEKHAATLVKALEQNLGTLPQQAINDVIDGTGINFAAATEQQVKDFAHNMNSAMRKAIGPKQWTEVSNSFEVHHKRVRKGSVEHVVDKYNLGVSTSLELKDQRAIKRAAVANTTFVKDRYGGTICPRTSEKARQIIHRGMDDGLGSRAIGRQMKRELGRYVQDQNRDYFNVVADAATARARERTAMTKYAEAGVSVVIISAVLDEATTETCRWLDGKILSVEESMQKYAAMDEAGDPEEVKWRLPWLRERKLTDGVNAGKTGIFMNREKGWRRVAVVHKPAYGTWDKGSAKGYGMPQMQKLGLGPPPYHGHCRTTTVPDVSYHPTVVQSLPGMREPQVRSPKPVSPTAPKQPKRVGPAQYLQDNAKLMERPGGVPIPLDEEHIENHDVRFRSERGADGKEMIVVHFKVPAAYGESIKNAVQDQFGARYKDVPFRVNKNSGKQERIVRGQGTASGYTALVGQHGSTEIRYWNTPRTAAMENRLELRIPTTDPAKAFEEYQKVMAKAGVKNASAFPSKVATETVMKARLIAQWDAQAGLQLRDAREVTPELVDKLYTEAAKRNPAMKKVLKDMRRMEVFEGHEAFYSNEQRKAIEAKGVKFLYHESSYHKDAVGILAGDGLQASHTRFDRGLFIEGMSTGGDFASGGASSVFTRASHRGSSNGVSGFYNWGAHDRYSEWGDTKGAPGLRFEIDTAQVGRSDWYAFGSDTFGRTARTYVEHRSHGTQIGTPGFSGGISNEIMFEGGISVQHIKRVYCGNDKIRTHLLGELKKRGVKEINGVKLEDFVRVNSHR